LKYRLPVLPVLDPRSDGAQDASLKQCSTADDLPERLYLDSGSSGIALALRHSGVGPGDEVLLPAFHCPTMADPVRAAGADVVFYRINADLSPNMDSIRNLLGARSKVLLVAHFFATGQDLVEARRLCDERHARLIEDCAHCYFGAPGDPAIGSIGDFAVFSTRKFFAGADGGILASKRHKLDDIALPKSGSVSEAKMTLDVFEEALEFGRSGWWALPARMAIAMRDVAKRAVHPDSPDVHAEPSSPPIPRLTSRPIVRPMSRISRFILRNVEPFATIEARRRNYQILKNIFASCRRVESLFTQTPFAPYMYPLVVENAEIYLALRRDGWPIWRWDDSDASCATSRTYAEHLLQIACHQSLTADDTAALGRAIVASSEQFGKS
jgi:dTDP-4-amino-4,6-dideoxygalactose transaminase